MKFVPLTVSVKPASPTVLLVGEMLVVVGTGFLTLTDIVPLLPPCVESPAYCAVTVTLPATLLLKLTEQVGEAPPPPSVQGEPVTVPVGAVTVTVPVGVFCPPCGPGSLTVTTHDVDCPRMTVDGVQFIVVVVARLIVIDALPELVLCCASPP